MGAPRSIKRGEGIGQGKDILRRTILSRHIAHTRWRLLQGRSFVGFRGESRWIAKTASRNRKGRNMEAPNKWLQQEIRESLSFNRAALCVLQFLPRASEHQGPSGD